MPEDLPPPLGTGSRPKRDGTSESGGEKDMNLAGLGLQLAAAVIIFVAFGWWLDSKTGWSPWGVVGCAMLGLAAGLYKFVRDALK